MYSARRKKTGFTLIELLVVIAIIAILAAIGLVVFNSAQRTGRIGKRIGDLKAIQTALAIFFQHNGRYPNNSAAWRDQCNPAFTANPDGILSEIVPVYMVKIPVDPRMDSTTPAQCYRYVSPTPGLDYKFQILNLSELTYQEWVNQKNFIDPTNDGGTDCSQIDPGTNPTNKSWAIYSNNTGVVTAVAPGTTTNPACWN